MRLLLLGSLLLTGCYPAAVFFANLGGNGGQRAAGPNYSARNQCTAQCRASYNNCQASCGPSNYTCRMSCEDCSASCYSY